ncbi:MAG: hypothetical protein ABFR53_11550 [Actinomycetota bacterium]
MFVVGSLIIGYVVGGNDPAMRSVTGLGTAQRNVAAAILVATVSFGGTLTLTFILVAAILIPIILLPTSKAMGRRSEPAATSTGA